MHRFHIGWRGVSLFPLVLLSGFSQPARAEDKQPVRLEVVLPEDAVLVINGYQTKSTGQTGRFESPPVPMGRTYLYTLKVSWHGHTLTRRTQVQPDIH